jgi:DMSO/TMAO reductase YedYZ molybdopterin-dependent catalytic subunit
VNQFEAVDDPNVVEVTEYQGYRLDSYTDFRENSIKGPQKVDIETYRLRVTGIVESELEYTYDQVLALQSREKVVQIDCVEGWSVRALWEGVLVKDIIEEAGVDPASKIIIFHAEDGYTTSLSLDYIIENDIMLAYKINTVTLPEANGYPFQLVAESKWGYKWCKWVTMLELSDDEDYKGFWESRGYNNDASIEGSKWEN